MKILIIEDNLNLAELTKMALEKHHYEVAICNDASEGVDHVRQYQPGLILIDILMPGLSGPEIVQILKRDPALMNIPIVFLSGLMAEDEKNLQDEGLKVDGVQFPILSKPYKSEQLLSMVKKHSLPS